MWTVIAGKVVKRRLDIKPLVGTDEHRLRIGGWRLIMKINEEEKQIFIRALGSCGDVYKK